MKKTVPPTGQSRGPRARAAQGVAGPSVAARRLDLNELLVFTRVVQAGSFTAAARLLGMPKSTVSRKVAELEERVGARLLQRTTRKLGLSDAGRAYFDHTARIVAQAEEAERALGRLEAAPRGLLRATAPLSLSVLAPIVAEYLSRYPEVRLELLCNDRRVDLVEEGFDVAVRVGRLEDSSLVLRPLGAIRRVLVAAPSYCAAHGAPKAPAELAHHAGIVFSGSPDPTLWSLRGTGARVSVRVPARVVANDLDVVREAARAGLGVAWLPEFAAEGDLRERRLVRLLPSWCSDDVPLQAVYPTARLLSPKVAAFVELLVARLSPQARRDAR